jgi:hypothetical protein
MANIKLLLLPIFRVVKVGSAEYYIFSVTLTTALFITSKPALVKMMANMTMTMREQNPPVRVLYSG